jgi:hypothetical protein
MKRRTKHRIPCVMACGREISLTFNPDGYCRKCRRKKKHADIRAKRKAEK